MGGEWVGEENEALLRHSAVRREESRGDPDEAVGVRELIVSELRMIWLIFMPAGLSQRLQKALPLFRQGAICPILVSHKFKEFVPLFTFK